ncbi:polysaccharide deacetylase family protein [Halorientalis regularis]|uniref:Polysaccharide deacetylase n=1 Tax=Halorientalis regularis TaxID=660518 RepID=A0A1G7T546_9EURY|nr:polysaccharide deacetylase family protein [Halorientalis regularis]SDG29740.1 Polysaccharide deacetylase [Halorientalis regularis]
MEDDGQVIISLDTELGWGFHGYDEDQSLSEDGRAERENIHRLLDLFDEFEAPATWAIVGHLFLESCDGDHASLDRPEWPHTGDWYAQDPGTDVECDPLRYGPDIITAIETAAPDHEIGSHTFSHVVCSEPTVTPDVLRSEIEASRELACERGHDVSTLVYPRNEARYRPALSEQGITAYRGKSPARKAVETDTLGGVRRYLRFMMGCEAPVVVPRRDESGVWDVPASQRLSYNPGSSSLNERFSEHPRVTMAKRAIERVSRDGGVYHLWDHPHAFTPEMFRDLRQILQAARKREVDIVTMREAVERVDREVTDD